MKESVQRFGRFLSGMVMPNIGAFIAWGIITALFIETGWLPNAQLAELVSPMLTYLLPLLIGYTGGYMVYEKRGAVVGSIASIGVIVGAGIPMFIGCMIMGPLGGFTIKMFDKLVDGKIKPGFEMLVNNFSAGILGFALACLGMLVINPICIALTEALGSGVGILVENGLLPLTSILVEPAKVLFLNNAINHGIFTPLGTEQALETGKSIFFLIESNPGPGLGLLLAYTFAGKGMAKSSAPGAIIIQFFGGIHEIYFPYVLMNPLTILALIAGGASGVFVNVLFNSGLVAPASPGSIFAILSMCEKGSYVGVILSIAVAAVVTWFVATLILKFTSKEDDDLEAAQQQVQNLKNNTKEENNVSLANVSLVTFACDAGMGSSAMGASLLRKKFQEEGIEIKVDNCAIDVLPEVTQVVVTQHSFAQRVKDRVPNAKVYTIQNFMSVNEYKVIVEEFKEAK